MSGRMRDTMPTVAELVDELRLALGRELVDKAIKAGMQGKGAFYATEVGADGQRLEVGRVRDSAPPVWTGTGFAWPERTNAWPVPDARHLRAGGAPTPTPRGSSQRPPSAGNSSPVYGLFRGTSKGVI
jgi:hypothetical protein